MAYAQYQNEITLPLHTLLSDDEAAYVAQTFRKLVYMVNKVIGKFV